MNSEGDVDPEQETDLNLSRTRMSGSVGAAIIGAGSYGAAHAEAMAHIPNVELVAASRTDSEALSKFVSRFGGEGYTDWRDVVTDKRVDAIVIATPHHLHTDIAVAAARAGKHILLEKPMALTLGECDRIIKASRNAGVKLQVGFVNHFVPAFAGAHQLIESGDMGRVVSGVATMSKDWAIADRRPWHLDRAYGGGMWMTAGIHCLDRLTWLIGGRVTQVSAQLDVQFHKQSADDSGIIFLRYDGGETGVVISTGYRVGAPKHSTELTCTGGMLNIDHADGLTVGRCEKWEVLSEFASHNWMHDALVAEWEAFSSAITGDTEPLVSGEYARHIVAVVLAAETSSELRREVDVASP